MLSGVQFESLVVCPTGLDYDTRADVRNMVNTLTHSMCISLCDLWIMHAIQVRSMGGQFESDLSPRTTHLVADAAGV